MRTRFDSKHNSQLARSPSFDVTRGLQNGYGRYDSGKGVAYISRGEGLLKSWPPVSSLSVGTVVRLIKIASLGELGRGSITFNAQSISRLSSVCCSGSGVVRSSTMVERVSGLSFVDVGRFCRGSLEVEFEGLASSKDADLGESASDAQLLRG